jgi:hypothetical protein
MSNKDNLLPGILARQERQKEFLQGLKDAREESMKGLAKGVATGAALWAGMSAYERYRRAKKV